MFQAGQGAEQDMLGASACPVRPIIIFGKVGAGLVSPVMVTANWFSALFQPPRSHYRPPGVPLRVDAKGTIANEVHTHEPADLANQANKNICEYLENATNSQLTDLTKNDLQHQSPSVVFAHLR